MMKFSLAPAITVLSAIGMLSADAAITGFGDGTGFTVNRSGGSAADTPAFSAGTVTLTTSTGSLATSVWYNTPQTFEYGFVASFTYETTGGADGFGFVLQNVGLDALGNPGGAKGYEGIGTSAGVMTNIYQNYSLGSGVSGSQQSFINIGLNLASGPSDYVVTYDPVSAPGVLNVTIQQSAGTYSRDLEVGDLGDLVGGPNAFVGFTGATGGVTATQRISNFSFTSIPEPSTVGLLGMAVLGVVVRRRR
jgi:hypothetical protein